METPEVLGDIVQKTLEHPLAINVRDIISQTATTLSLLPLEPWQVALAKVGGAGLVTGFFALTVASHLHANEGRTRFQKNVANAGLAIMGAGAAAADILILTVPF